MSLHVEVSGHGEPLVLLHGWGMHGGIWGEVAETLAQYFEVHRVDLPGHGASAPLDAFTLDTVVDNLAAEFEQTVNVLGWSLGGIIAQYWAIREPQKVKRLALVASTPCFSNRADWNCGMMPETLEQFATELENNFAATLRRFLALQVRGSDNERALLSAMREKLFSHGDPNIAALRGGLDILRDVDLREVLVRITQPSLIVAGERDKLIPTQASQYMASAMPNAQLVEIRGAAHAPFLSHQEIFVEHLNRFLNGKV